MECFSPCGYVKETWREDFFSGDPEGYLEIAQRRALLFIGKIFWETWRRARLPGNLRAG
jgi:hypothetical protein